MAYHCPECSAVILSRRNPLCSSCHQPLPSEIVFSPAKIAEIEAEERAREQACKDRGEERQRKASAISQSQGAGDFGFFGG